MAPKDMYRNANHPTLFAVIALILVIMAVVSFTLYLFIKAIRLNDAAGVHIFRNANALPTYTVPYAGKDIADASNWVTHEDPACGISVTYPRDWQAHMAKQGYVTVRKLNWPQHELDSLAFTVTVWKVMENTDDSPENILKVRDVKKINKQTLGGRDVYRSGPVEGNDELVHESAVWKIGNDVFEAEAVYYNKNSFYLEDTFNIILAHVKPME